jgi:poly(A) polymerase
MEENQTRETPPQSLPQESTPTESAPSGVAGGERPRGRRRRRSRRGRGRGAGAGQAQAVEAGAGQPPSAAPHAAPRAETSGRARPAGEPRGRRPAGEPRRQREERDDGLREHRRDPRSEAPRGLALDPEMPNPAHDPEIALERLDRDAVKVISRLRHMGHQAYFVGGCVRDVLLGRRPKDFDLATDAHPGEVRAIFRNCRLIGRRFRLAHVFFRDGKIIEVATFRANPIDVADDVPTDADLLITRDNVFGTAEEDARRRDFTVNGLFYDPFRGEVIDYVGGRADLEAHRISTIGDPEIRMREDPVRALRAVRFAARLGFTIEPEVFEAMRRHAGELARCAPPRVLEEIFKILRCTGSARAFELLRASGILPVVLPSLSQALDASGGEARGRFQAHLAALDAQVRDGEDVSDAVLLGALLVHLHAGPQGPDGADALLAELVLTARLPRKMAERTRMALRAQKLFHAPPRRRRRGGLAAQAYFDDALTLLRLSVQATGQGQDALARWENEGGRGRDGEEIDPSLLEEAEATPAVVAGPGAASAGPASTSAGVPPGEGEGADEQGPDGRRRRRRRGGRRRRRRGQGSASPDAPSAPPATPGAT